MIGRVMTVSHESKGMLDGQVGPMDAQHHIVIDADQRQAGESHGTHGTQALLRMLQPAATHGASPRQQERGDIGQ